MFLKHSSETEQYRSSLETGLKEDARRRRFQPYTFSHEDIWRKERHPSMEKILKSHLLEYQDLLADNRRAETYFYSSLLLVGGGWLYRARRSSDRRGRILGALIAVGAVGWKYFHERPLQTFRNKHRI